LKRHRSLHPLSEHHHHVLVQALTIRRAGDLPATRRRAAFRQAARALLRFWKRSGQKHFREEEEVLLPAYARHVSLEQDRDVVRLLADHAAIRAAYQDLAATLAAGRPVEEPLTALGRRLHDHVRLEEEKVFPRMEAVLGEAGLNALGFTRLHGKKRS